jgi:hypothetical protein
MANSPFFGLALGACLTLITGAARAEDDVLVFSRPASSRLDAFEQALRAEGHEVTRADALPADVSRYRSVWVVRTDRLDRDEVRALTEYVREGGALVYLSERFEEAPREDAQGIIQTLLPGRGVSIAHPIDAQPGAAGDTSLSVRVPTVLSASGVALSLCNVGGAAHPGARVYGAGAILGVAARNRLLATHATASRTVAGVWAGADLPTQRGALVVMRDTSWTDAPHVAENTGFLRVLTQLLDDLGTGRCDPDRDAVMQPFDNCAGVANPDQADADRDSVGDACDPDDDNDCLPDSDPRESGVARIEASLPAEGRCASPRAVCVEDQGVGRCLDATVTVLTPGELAALGATRPRVTGSAPAWSDVVVRLDGQVLGRAVTDATGRWSVVSPAAITVGTHSLVATMARGGASSEARRFTVGGCTSAAECGGATPVCANGRCVECHESAECSGDSERGVCSTEGASAGMCVPPPPVIGTPEQGFAEVGTHTVIEGRATAGQRVALTLDGELIGSADCDTDGRFVYEVPMTLSLGWHAVSAHAVEDGLALPEGEAHRFPVVGCLSAADCGASQRCDAVALECVDGG